MTPKKYTQNTLPSSQTLKATIILETGLGAEISEDVSR